MEPFSHLLSSLTSSPPKKLDQRDQSEADDEDVPVSDKKNEDPTSNKQKTPMKGAAADDVPEDEDPIPLSEQKMPPVHTRWPTILLGVSSALRGVEIDWGWPP